MANTVDSRAIEGELFAYAAGALDASSRVRLEETLSAEPALRARLAWYEAVCEGVIQSEAPLKDPPSADEILERIRGKERKRGFFGWLAGAALKPAVAIAFALIVIQGGIIATLIGERTEPAPVRSAAPPGQAVTLVVAFDPEARESAIRALLVEAEATIVGGPKQLGEYRLSVAANRADFARSLFEHSELVEYVRVEER